MAFEDTVRAVLDHKGVGVCAVHPDTAVFDALAIMSDQDIGAVLVVDDGALRGVMSERDYARKVILEGKSSKDTPVREIMSEPVVTANLADNIAQCMRAMTDHRVRYLPVVDHEALIGVVSIGDLVNWVIRRQEEEIHHLHGYISGSYPA
jgi:CBS domain-containing protein